VRTTWRLLRRHRDLRLVLGAGLVSLTGDQLLAVGLAYYVYALTGSTAVSAATWLTLYLPSIALSSLAGVFVDRWDRLRTMVIANLLLAAGLLPLLAVHDRGDVWIVYLVTTWEGVVALFFSPAERAMVPRLVPDEDLVAANAVNGQVRDVSRLVGAAVGGVVVAAGGIKAVTLVDVGTFVVAVALLVGVRTSGAVAAEAVDTHAGRLGGVRAEWSEGVRAVTSHPVLRVVALFTLVAMTGEGVMGTLFAPFVRDVLHGSGTDFGVVVAVQAVGGIVGGLAAVTVGQRLTPRAMFGAGAIVFGLVDLALFLYPLGYVAVWPAIALMVVVGLPGAVLMAGYATLVQRSTTDAFRGRVSGALDTVVGIGVVTGSVLAGLLGDSVGIIPVLSAQGAAYVLAGVLVLISLRRVPAAAGPPPGTPVPT
jgi:Na+/melibiose symporter-like transporter